MFYQGLTLFTSFFCLPGMSMMRSLSSVVLVCPFSAAAAAAATATATAARVLA